MAISSDGYSDGCAEMEQLRSKASTIKSLLQTYSLSIAEIAQRAETSQRYARAVRQRWKNDLKPGSTRRRIDAILERLRAVEYRLAYLERTNSVDHADEPHGQKHVSLAH
jgi:hypothetical protein